MKRGSFIFYATYYEAMQKQDPMTRLKFYEAVMEYAVHGNITDLSDDSIAEGFFQMVQPLLDTSIRNYQNGCKGGRPRKKERQDKTETKENTEEVNDDAVPAAENDRRGAEKIKYGQHNNVRLSTDDYNMLVNSHGEEETQDAIEELDLYIETLSPDKKEDYIEKNHAACMESWAYRAARDRKAKDAQQNSKVRNFIDLRDQRRPWDEINREYPPGYFDDLEKTLLQN